MWAARENPGEGGFHRRLVAQHGKMLLDRGSRNAGRRETLAQPFGIVGKNNIGGAGLEKSLVVPRAVRLIAILHLQGAIEGVGMRPRQDGERAQPLRKTIGQRPGNAAAPVMADEMKAALAVT